VPFLINIIKTNRYAISDWPGSIVKLYKLGIFTIVWDLAIGE
jgi:hypothetical protein